MLRKTWSHGLWTSCAACLVLAAISPVLAQTTYEYDALGRLIKTNYDNGSDITYSYDEVGNITSIVTESNTPSFSINDVTVTEGGSAVFTVTKTGTTSQSYSVDFSTVNGTATAGSDYTSQSNTLTFSSTETSKTITIATTDDPSQESAETFNVNLSNATGGATITDANGVATITDNDTPSGNIVLTLVDPVTDLDIRVLSLNDTISTSELSNGVSYTFRADYTGAGTVLSMHYFENGVFVKQEQGSPYSRFGDSGPSDYWTGDNLPTSAFTVGVKFFDGLGGSGNLLAEDTYSLGVSTGSAPSFSINDVTVTEGGSAVFTVTKTGTTSQSYSVDFSTANGTATAGSDYTSQSNTLTFGSSEISKTITISTTDDSSHESTETFNVNLSNATGGAAITDGTGLGTINDNDAETPPSFAINDVTVTEGDSAVFTATKTGTVTQSYSVNYSTLNGTATAGSDYTSQSGTLTFASGETTKTITISTIDETPVAGEQFSETFSVNLSSATGGATITDSEGVGTILDDDAS